MGLGDETVKEDPLGDVVGLHRSTASKEVGSLGPPWNSSGTVMTSQLSLWLYLHLPSDLRGPCSCQGGKQ